MDQNQTVVETAEDSEGVEEKAIRFTPTGKISHAKTRVYTQRYRKEWETTPDFQDWLTSVPFQATRAYCKFCQRNLHAHRLSLLKHMCTLKHQRAAVQYTKRQEEEAAQNRQGNDTIYVQQADTDDEEDDDGTYDESNFVPVDDEEEEILEYQEEVLELENDNDEPASKRIRIQNDDGQDALAQAMAHVDPDLLDENNEEIHLHLVSETDDNDGVPENQLQIVKCESLDPKMSNSPNKSARVNSNDVKESAKVLFASDISKTDVTSETESAIADTAEPKKVLLLSPGGKSFTVLKGKLPQFLLNSTNTNNVIKRDKTESKVTRELKLINNSASTSQEVTDKINYSKALAVTTKSILMKKPVISTHVLETSKGVPVSGLQIILYKLDDGRWKNLHEGYTSAHGAYDFSNTARLNLTVGRYRLHYDVEKYYSSKKISTIYPFIEIVFDVKDPGATYNIPLLMSPYSYSTFKDFPR